MLRFRSYAAKYAVERSFDAGCLRKDDSPMSAWYDNYDLDVRTPNGRRETHAMVIELTQHALPAGNDDDPNIQMTAR